MAKTALFAGVPAERMMSGARIYLRSDVRRYGVEVAFDCGRVHSGKPQPEGCSQHHQRRRDRHTGGTVRLSRPAESHSQRQRIGVHREGNSALVAGVECGHAVHRTGSSVAERLRRKSPQSSARRTTGDRRIRKPCSRTSTHDDMATGLQRTPSAQLIELSHAERIRSEPAFRSSSTDGSRSIV